MATTPTTRPTATFGRRKMMSFSPGALIGLVRVVARRLWSHLALMVTIAAGFIVAIALTVCIPVYAEAVGYRILREELSVNESGARRPPFAFMYRYLASQSGAIGAADFTRIDTYMEEQIATRLNLPIEFMVRYIATDKMPIMPISGVGEPLMWVNVATASDLESHITIVDGRLPQPRDDGDIEVLIHEEMASRLGLQIDERYLLFEQRKETDIIRINARIAGVWRADSDNDPYWFYQPATLKETFFIDRDAFETSIIRSYETPIYVALWYLNTDGSHIRSADVAQVRAYIARTSADLGTILPGMRLDISPADALAGHQQQVQRLTLILSIFSIPVLGLIAYFIMLVAGLVVQRQSNEIAVLRSRGASRAQVLLVYLMEWVLLGTIALVLGLGLGQAAGLIMTWTRSFLELIPGEVLPIELTPDAWQRAWQMLLLLVFASLLPAFAVARYTIVSFKSERARAGQKPFWQRFYLDILLLIPVWYGYSLLQQRGTIAFLGGAAGDPFGNPLLLLAPSLFVFALALVATRIFPMFMTMLAWLAERLPGISIVTALRYLARTPSAYTGPVLLLILTLSLATFTASMARTLDNHLYDQAYYDNGGDMRVYDLGQATQSAAGPGGSPQPTPPPNSELQEARFLFLPVTEYLAIPGVEAATRVSVSQVDFRGSSDTLAGRFVGVDRVDLTRVVRWRSDYAGESLGALMNRLADDPSNVLVSNDLARRLGLRIGDRITMLMSDLDRRREVSATVAGYVGLFPTIYPGDGPFVVGNLDYAFDQQGGMYPYDVWMKITPGTTRADLSQGFVELSLATFERGFIPQEIQRERERPERQGFYGLLSVGFVASAFLTVLGFLFYSVLSFQRRFVELGMLRAIGLSSRQLGALLACEQALIIGAGGLAGTLIGIASSQLFIPFLQVRRGQNAQIPPFLVEIAWEQIGIIYIVFGGMLLLAVLVMLGLLRRMKLFQAVKLGEAI
ncbi:MAG TPA: FtsX-like permease family protein [Roseiflexaceae bacterium]|nr:FtsX-like permease family protein [Roseiflexaceae bacterium]